MTIGLDILTLVKS